jgi:hypothetical protein
MLAKDMGFSYYMACRVLLRFNKGQETTEDGKMMGKRKNSAVIVFVFHAPGVNRGGGVYAHLSDPSFVMTNEYEYALGADSPGVV